MDFRTNPSVSFVRFLIVVKGRALRRVYRPTTDDVTYFFTPTCHL
jgi:hypothetical protein